MNLYEDRFPNGDALMYALYTNIFSNVIRMEPFHYLNYATRAFHELFHSEQEIAIGVIDSVNRIYNRNFKPWETYNYKDNGSYFEWSFKAKNETFSEEKYIVNCTMPLLFSRYIQTKYSKQEYNKTKELINILTSSSDILYLQLANILITADQEVAREKEAGVSNKRLLTIKAARMEKILNVETIIIATEAIRKKNNAKPDDALKQIVEKRISTRKVATMEDRECERLNLILREKKQRLESFISTEIMRTTEELNKVKTIIEEKKRKQEQGYLNIPLTQERLQRPNVYLNYKFIGDERQEADSVIYTLMESTNKFDNQCGEWLLLFNLWETESETRILTKKQTVDMAREEAKKLIAFAFIDAIANASFNSLNYNEIDKLSNILLLSNNKNDSTIVEVLNALSAFQFSL